MRFPKKNKEDFRPEKALGIKPMCGSLVIRKQNQLLLQQPRLPLLVSRTAICSEHGKAKDKKMAGELLKVEVRCKDLYSKRREWWRLEADLPWMQMKLKVEFSFNPSQDKETFSKKQKKQKEIRNTIERMKRKQFTNLK